MIPEQAAIQAYFDSQPVQRAYLFGSQARNKATPDSDVDILVELEPKVSLFDFVRMQMHLESLLQTHVDLVSANGLSPRIQPCIDQDKILIYEKPNQR